MLGIRLYEHCVSKLTWLLAQNIITSLQAPLGKTYKKNLAIDGEYYYNAKYKTSMVITTLMFAQQKKFANEAKDSRFNL